jgi:hypothetical protein
MLFLEVFQEHIFFSLHNAQKKENFLSLNISHVMSIVYASDYQAGEGMV